MTRASTVVFSSLVAAGWLAACDEASTSGDQAGARPAAAEAGGTPDTVVVYYFHGTHRCQTCLGIQATVERTIQEHFAVETSSGVLSFRDINIDQPEYAQLVKEYAIGSSSMVVAAKKGQATVKWELCDKAWDYADDEPALSDYATQRIRTHLALLESEIEMKIKVLGTGCPKCKQLYAEAEKAVAASGQAAELEKVDRIADIMKYGVMMTPALVIDEEVKASGRIPPVAEIVTWIMNAALGGAAKKGEHERPSGGKGC